MCIKNGLCLLLLMMIGTMATAGELVVIANPGVRANSLPQGQLARLFLGQSNSFPDGSQAQPIDGGSSLRNSFDESILKRSPDQIEKYWARMIFTGKAQQPRQARSEELKALVAETPGAISYIDKSQVDTSVKVISITP